jgi:O-antigen ligase
MGCVAARGWQNSGTLAGSADVEVAVRTADVLAVFRRATRSSFWLLCADIYPALVAASIPWSTTAVAAFMMIWFVLLLPTINHREFVGSLKQPAFWLPLALFALVILGMLWSDAAWPERLRGISPAAKLPALPFLLYHFQRSQRGHWVFVAFLLSCTALMLASWSVLYAPDWRMTHWGVAGVPIKNTIDQSQEFGLCIFALCPVALTLFRQRRHMMAAACAALILAFFASLMFVAIARTALVYMPVLLMLFALKYLGRRAALALFGAAMATALVVWSTSPYLRLRVSNIAIEYRDYKETHLVTSTGERIEWWGKSLDFIGEAPLFGNGTGSIKHLFERNGVVLDGWRTSIENPHNQTLNVAIQWGLLGCVILYAMWCSHLLLFGGFSLAAWVGLIVVVQNFVSSMFNSHLFDFNEGWIYVVGVGTAGGLVLNQTFVSMWPKPEGVDFRTDR